VFRADFESKRWRDDQRGVAAVAMLALVETRGECCRLAAPIHAEFRDVVLDGLLGEEHALADLPLAEIPTTRVQNIRSLRCPKP
jgi:hypothetical protein